jgi:hypothetical protein
MKLPALKGGELNTRETNRPSLIKGKAETACGGFNQSLRRFQAQKSPAIVRFQLGISERICPQTPVSNIGITLEFTPKNKLHPATAIGVLWHRNSLSPSPTLSTLFPFLSKSPRYLGGGKFSKHSGSSAGVAEGIDEGLSLPYNPRKIWLKKSGLYARL